jgi:sugar lactone lactonase YvrE
VVLRKILIGFVALAVLFLIYLLFWPVPIDPAAWTPPEAPALTGVYEPNTLLAAVERIGVGAGVGPEDVAIDGQGRIYGGMQDGRILRSQADGSQFEVFAETEGQPLGLQFDAAGNLVVCDAYRGLLSITPDGSITVLSTEQGGVPFRLTDDVDIAADGTIYFSDASYKFSGAEYMADLMEHRPNGRLLAYDPSSNTTQLVLDKLYFANGVAVSPDQSFVLVAETGKYRVQRYWLNGSKKGESDIFIENLPGFPDGISSNGKDMFWLALIQGPESRKDMDSILPQPFKRKIFMRLPESASAPKNDGFVLGLDIDGRVMHNLQDPSGSYVQITSIEEYDGMLYLGSAVEDAIGRLPVPQTNMSRRSNI